MDVAMTGENHYRVVTLGDVTLYFSYSTLVAVRAPGVSVRTAQHYSKTTSRHLVAMRCASFDTMPDDSFRAWVPVILAATLAGKPVGVP